LGEIAKLWRLVVFSGAAMGHVMAHEIGHSLQGTTQNSESGIMKARWTGQDFTEMARRPLGFSGPRHRSDLQGTTESQTIAVRP
jgi:hypothetical protein